MRKLAAILVISVLLLSCRVEDEPSASSFSVVAVDFPSYDAARAVLGGTDGLTMLLPPGVESHSYDPTAKDMVRIAEASLVVYTGGPSESWVNTLLSSLSDPPELFSLMEQVDTLQEERKEGMDEGSGHRHDHAEADEHVWTSPVNEMVIIRNLADTVSSLDEERREHYEANALSYISCLEEIDREIRAVVDSAPLKTLIFASRFPLVYFVREYGLDYYAAFPGCAEESEPSARTVAFLIDKARELDVPCILNVEMSSDLIARTIAEETGVPVREFSSLHNVSALDFAGGADYLSVMERNIEVLKEALGASGQR